MTAVKNEIKTYFGRCRCCLGYDYLKDMWEEYYWEGEKEVYVQMLVECFALSWDQTEATTYQDQICESCIKRLRDALIFKKTIMQSQVYLLDNIEEIKTESEIEDIAEADDTQHEDTDDNKQDDFEYKNLCNSENPDGSLTMDETKYEVMEYLEDDKIEDNEALAFLCRNNQKTYIGKKRNLSDNNEHKKKLPRLYTEDELKECLEAIKNKTVTLSEASDKYNISKSTIVKKFSADIKGNNMVAEADDKVTVAPSTSKQPISIGVSVKNADEIIGEWLELTDDLSDCDMDTEDEDCFFPVVTSHNATAEPALDTDMTLYQTRVLETEDRHNDQAIREIAPPDSYNFQWKKDRRVFTGQRENFTGIPGPTFSITDQTTMVDIFYKMIDTDFIDRICTETNRYAAQKIKLLKDQNKFSSNLRLHRWTPTDRDEMTSFLVISILQGLYPLPKEESYFSFNGFGTMPYFRKIMSFNRFLLLKSLLHFVDNETITEPDQLCKIQMVSDYFNDKFSHLYYPSQEIVIDESLLKWHGRLSFAQKISSKAAQVGVKTYELCESCSGYLWKFFIYAGKQKTGTATATATTSDEPNPLETDETNPLDTDDIPDERPDDTDTTERDKTGSRNVRHASAKIVYALVEPLLHRGHTLIMDNFYNSPLLARCLKRQQTDCFGTLRLNREFVPDSLKTITKTELRQGEVLASYCSDLSVIVWRDANIVSMLSTYHSLQIGTRVKYNRLTYKPSVVLDYNKTMGGVDRKDQFLSTHPMERQRNRIWYKKVFRRLFNCAIFNCFIIFKTVNPTVSHRQFRITLAENLLKIHRRIDLTTEPRLINTRTGQMTKPKTRPVLEHRHFPVKTGFKQSRCWLCAQQQILARTVWKCLECNINLCIEGCFMAYHTY